MMSTRLILVMLLFSAIVCVKVPLAAEVIWPVDAQSTTGPAPPRGICSGSSIASITGQKLITGVPAYIWNDGCGPTAAGMVIGYWDAQGFGNLVAGDASTQTPSVDSMISSSGNYDDYCLPIDYSPNMKLDKSELPIGDEHSNDCLADFMFTSQSHRYNYYGWSWYSDVAPALANYASTTEPACQASATSQMWSSSLWANYCAEIDAGRPVVLLVDSDSNGGTDHFIAAIGYGYSGTTRMYACLNTWDGDVHWYQFAQMASGQPWGLYGAVFFNISGGTVGSARLLTDDSTAKIHGAIVTAAFQDDFYVESPDRACGLRVERTSHGLSTGMRVDLSGTMKTDADGERYLACAYASQDGTGEVFPFGMGNQSLGGVSWQYNSSTGAGQQGITNGIGPNNIGLLVSTWGKVTYKGSDYIYIDDGSALQDDSGNTGLKVDATGLTLPDVDQFVMVTGASSCFKSGSTVYPRVRANEILVLQE